jgi:hypothetical protein
LFFISAYAGGNDAAGSDNIAMLEKAVPGIPGQDYPILAEVPETAFSCSGQVDGGYYADKDAQCQVFHICTSDGQVTKKSIRFSNEPDICLTNQTTQFSLQISLFSLLVYF